MCERFPDSLQEIAEHSIEDEDDADWLAISLSTVDDLAYRLRERLTELKYWS